MVGVLVASATVLGLGAFPAGSDTLTVETFQGPAVADPTAWVAGGSGSAVPNQWPGKACLTAGANTSQTPIPGCGLTTPDPSGTGALRLTTDGASEGGFALFQTAQTTAAGLDITFHQAQWSNAITPADGISFFLVDGSTTLTQPGQIGGALGYATDGSVPGVTNGLIGIGLDVFGNYANSGNTHSTSGCAAGTGPGSNGPAGARPEDISVRGPGTGTTGYCWLGDSGTLPPTLELHEVNRSLADRTVRIVIDPATVLTPNVTVFLNGTQVVQVPAPQALLSASTFKFGFAASTGTSVDNHEVWGLTVNTVLPIATTTMPAPVITQPRFTG